MKVLRKKYRQCMWWYKLQGLFGFGWLHCEIFWNPSPRAMGNKPKPGKCTCFNFKAGVQKRKPSEMKKATQNAKKYLQTKIPTSNSSPKPTKSSRCGNISKIGFRKNIASFCCSIQFSFSVVSDSLWPNGPQHAQLPCPSSTPGAYSNSHPLSRWCHPTISSSVVSLS